MAQWRQWGGPNRDFTCEAKDLAERWPADGPRQLWKRPLGDGYSTILFEDGVLYTMYRTGDDEFTVALRARDGSTLWEHKNPSPFTKTIAEFGPGPHATPLLAEDRLYSVGSNGVLHCFDKASGNVRWKHDLIREFDGELRARGYSCSPIAYKHMLILPLGSEKGGPGALAFDQKTGGVIWRALQFRATYATPLLIRFHDEDQLVLFMASELVGVNPASGEVLWTVEHRNQVSVNASTPVWDGKDVLFCSNAYDGGARALRFTHENGKTGAEGTLVQPADEAPPRKRALHQPKHLCVERHGHGILHRTEARNRRSPLPRTRLRQGHVALRRPTTGSSRMASFIKDLWWFRGRRRKPRRSERVHKCRSPRWQHQQHRHEHRQLLSRGLIFRRRPYDDQAERVHHYVRCGSPVPGCILYHGNRIVLRH
jgi:hypothetical protein